MKLHIIDRERRYELTYLVAASLTSDELSKLREQVKATITKYKGEVIEMFDWGRKMLEYPIKHEGKNYNEAVYTHTLLSLPSKSVEALDRDLRLNTGVIRHLLVIAEEIKPQAEKPVVAAQSAPATKSAAAKAAPTEQTATTKLSEDTEKSAAVEKKVTAKPKTTRSKKPAQEQTTS